MKLPYDIGWLVSVISVLIGLRMMKQVRLMNLSLTFASVAIILVYIGGLALAICTGALMEFGMKAFLGI